MIGERTTVVLPWRALRRPSGGPDDEAIGVWRALSIRRTSIITDCPDPAYVKAWIVNAGTTSDDITYEARSAFRVAREWLNGGHGSVLYLDNDPEACGEALHMGAGVVCVGFDGSRPEWKQPRSWDEIVGDHPLIGSPDEDHLRRSGASS